MFLLPMQLTLSHGAAVPVTDVTAADAAAAAIPAAGAAPAPAPAPASAVVLCACRMVSLAALQQTFHPPLLVPA